jgi:isopropylmalate/homocitrate/citramalate synthase
MVNKPGGHFRCRKLTIAQLLEELNIDRIEIFARVSEGEFQG